MPPSADILYKGKEQQPVLVVDDFFPDLDGLVADAISRKYSKIGPFYPGIRSQVPPAYTNFVVESLNDVIRETFDYPSKPLVEEGMYSLVTTPPEDLIPIQLFPHYDGVDPHKLAVLHYLHGPEMGGTAFFRHRSTGYETVTEDRFEHFKSTFEAEVGQSGIPEAAYINDSTDLFEKIFEVEAKPNRLVIYRGVNLHSAKLSNDISWSDDPRKGRLTVNTFLVADISGT